MKPKLKTIYVVYVQRGEQYNSQKGRKHYVFNTKDDLRVGMHLSTRQYESLLYIESILPDTYQFVNLQTGVLTKKASPNVYEYPIRLLCNHKLCVSPINTIDYVVVDNAVSVSPCRPYRHAAVDHEYDDDYYFAQMNRED
jgi:hypothetical protein